MTKKAIDLKGQRFGKLLVLDRLPNEPGKSAIWKCLCDCGNFSAPNSSSLRAGKTKTCGCEKASSAKDRFTKHGLRYTREYRIWLGMKDRCSNPKSTHYQSYGGRGIKVCKEWSDDFMAFYTDMGPSGNLSIERIDNNSGYCKQNCKWATQKEQSINRRNAVFLYVDGQRMRVKDICEKYGVSQSMMRHHGVCIRENDVSAWVHEYKSRNS